MKGDVLWWCRSGHTELQPAGVTAVYCPRPGHPGTNEMKPRALFPTWGPDEPPKGEGRRCCRTYPDEPHRPPCRWAQD